MPTNEGSTDRIVRIVIAVAAAIAALVVGGAVGVVLWVVTAIMLVTAATGFCPIYRVVGLNTCRRPAAHR